MAKANKNIQVTLLKSKNGILPNHKACLTGLGLRRIRHTVTIEDTPYTRGMINAVSHMVKVEEQ